MTPKINAKTHAFNVSKSTPNYVTAVTKNRHLSSSKKWKSCKHISRWASKRYHTTSLYSPHHFSLAWRNHSKVCQWERQAAPAGRAPKSQNPKIREPNQKHIQNHVAQQPDPRLVKNRKIAPLTAPCQKTYAWLLTKSPLKGLRDVWHQRVEAKCGAGDQVIGGAWFGHIVFG